MKRFVLPLLSLALLAAPVTVSARLINDLPAGSAAVAKTGRRTVREQARRPLLPNLSRLRPFDVDLDATYVNADFNLSIRYPSTWERNDLNERDVGLTLPVMFLSPYDGGEARQNVNLVIEHLDEPMTLADYTDLGIRNEQMFFEDYTLVSSQSVPLGAYRAQRVVFTASGTNGLAMKFVQVWYVRGTDAYVWTFADEAATFDRNIATFERMLDSYIAR
jgi:hypothetical protein